MGPAIAVVGLDRLALACAARLRSNVEVVQIPPERLLAVRVSVDAAGVEIDGHRIVAFLWRAPVVAAAAAAFTLTDRAFALAELSATLLAATQHRSVVAVNRLDAELWFEEGQWAVWRQRLRRAGVAVCPLRVGDADGGRWWRPYLWSGDRPVPGRAARRTLGTAIAEAPMAGAALFVSGEPLGAGPPPAVVSAARILNDDGVPLAAISYDSDGRVVGVDPHPHVPDELVDPACERITRLLHDGLRDR